MDAKQEAKWVATQVETLTVHERQHTKLVALRNAGGPAQGEFATRSKRHHKRIGEIAFSLDQRGYDRRGCRKNQGWFARLAIKVDLATKDLQFWEKT